MHSLNADQWVEITGILMALTLIGGNWVRRGARISRAALPTLIWLVLVWAGIISAAALAFHHFRPGQM